MKRKNKGFTIVELVIVIAVIAILAAVLIPTFTSVIDNANNSADVQLAANLNTVLSTNIDEDTTATAENIRKFLKDNGYEAQDIVTKKKDNILAWNKESKKIEVVNINSAEIGVEPAAATNRYSTVADKNDLKVDFAAYSPEEIFNGFTIVSTGGNDLAEGLYKLHNWESAPSAEGSDILNKVFAINENIKYAITSIVAQTLYVTLNGDMFRLSVNDNGTLTVDSTQDIKRVVFNEECKDLSLNTLAENLNDEAVTVVLPKTLETVTTDADAGSLERVTFVGNTEIVGEDESGATLSPKSLSEMHDNIVDNSALIGNPTFNVSATTEEEWYYKNLNDALAFAMQSYQLSGNNKTVKFADSTYTINSDVVIPKGITLLLPYDTSKNTERGVGVSGTQEYEAGVNGTIRQNADITSARDDSESNCDLTVTVTANTKIIVNGSLKIGGITTGGNGGKANAGRTCSGYAKLVLGANAVIESNGVIESYGFIEEESEDNGSKVILNSGSLKMPFVVVEHRGGQILGAIYFQQGAPFNRFFLENVNPLLTVKSSASLLGYGNLYASSRDNTTDIKLIGNSNEYMLNINGYVTAKTNKTSNTMKLDVYGDTTLNALQMIAAGQSVTTQNVMLPISSLFDISFHTLSGNDSAEVISSVQKFKILPGGKVTIDKGVTFTAPEIFVADSNYTFYNIGTTASYEVKEDGHLIVNGTLNVNTLGGTIENNVDNAILKVTESNTSKTVEVKSGSNMFNVVCDTPTQTLKGKTETSNGVAVELAVGTYVSKSGTWTKQPVQ